MPTENASLGEEVSRQDTQQEPSGEKVNDVRGQTGLKKTSLMNRLWPISLDQLKAHKIPSTDLLRMTPTVWYSSVIINLLGVGLPILILQVYDRIIPNQSLNTLVMMIFGFIGILTLEFFLRIGRAYVLGWSATRFEMSVAQDAITRLLKTPLSQVSSDRTQTQLDRLTSVSRLADFFGGPNSLLIIDLPFVLIFVGVMFLIGGSLVLVPIGILTVFAVLTVSFGRNLKAHFEAREVQDNRTYDFIAECLHGVITLKGLAMEPFMLRRFERLQKSRAITNYKTIAASANAQSISASLGNVTIVTVVTAGAIHAVNGDLSIGTLAACTLLAGRIIQPVVRFAGLWSEFQKLELALKEAAELFELPQGNDEKVIDGRDGAPTIDLNNVRFKGEGGRDLGPFNLSIKSGECIGIIGPDDLSKHGFLKTVAGLEPPLYGQVKYNHIDVESYRLGNPSSIVFVGPKSAVFDGTILENVTLFGSGPTIEEVRWAAQMTGVDYEINCLPQGYDTQIGDSAAEKLPLGIVRRIVLTRAIAMLPKVLVLDEPQMFLDAASDKKLVQCLAAMKQYTTIVMSTLRPSYFHLADRMLKFENGEVMPLDGNTRQHFNLNRQASAKVSGGGNG